LPNMFGNPPNCKPECYTSQECNLNQVCISQRCQDGCLGACGYSARCEMINHSKKKKY
jgi:hypothetical protein